MQKYHCVIADDEPYICKGIASFINSKFPEISVDACFEDGSDVLDYIKSGRPLDFVVLDIKMVTVSGLEVSQYIFDNRLPIKVIAITGYREFDYAVTAINQRIESILLKPISFEKLQTAITNILNSIEERRNFIADHKKILVEHEINRILLKKVFRGFVFDELNAEEKERVEKLDENFLVFSLELQLLSKPELWDEIQHSFFGEFLGNNPDMYYLDFISNVMHFIGLMPKDTISPNATINQYVENLVSNLEGMGISCNTEIITHSSLKSVFYSRAGTREENQQKRYNNILTYIDENYNKDFSLSDIAQKFYMSEAYFSRFFKKYNGQSFVVYLAQYRIDKAKQMIYDGYPLQDISSMVGYKAYKTFSKRFKEIVGVTPKEFKQRGR